MRRHRERPDDVGERERLADQERAAVGEQLLDPRVAGLEPAQMFGRRSPRRSGRGRSARRSSRAARAIPRVRAGAGSPPPRHRACRAVRAPSETTRSGRRRAAPSPRRRAPRRAPRLPARSGSAPVRGTSRRRSARCPSTRCRAGHRVRARARPCSDGSRRTPRRRCSCRTSDTGRLVHVPAGASSVSGASETQRHVGTAREALLGQGEANALRAGRALEVEEVHAPQLRDERALRILDSRHRGPSCILFGIAQ